MCVLKAKEYDLLTASRVCVNAVCINVSSSECLLTASRVCINCVILRMRVLKTKGYCLLAASSSSPTLLPNLLLTLLPRHSLIFTRLEAPCPLCLHYAPLYHLILLLILLPTDSLIFAHLYGFFVLFTRMAPH